MANVTAPTPNHPPHHRLSVHGQQGALTFAFEATFAAPWTILFGPSGCGKSTLLRAMCGLRNGLTVHCVRIPTNNEAPILLEGPSQGILPEHRRLAYAPQQAGLFPHLSVAENIAFAQTVRRQPPATSLTREVMALLQLENLAQRRPRELSGGEQQRVSLARALAVPDAALMLLDEPFAGVDRALRNELLPRVQAHLRHRAIPVLSVTHDVDEAFLLQAEVIRLENGKNAAQGSARSVLTPEAQSILQILGQTQSTSVEA